MNSFIKIGKIKLFILIACFLMNILAPMNMIIQLNLLIAILFPFLFGAIAIPLIVKFNILITEREIVPPSWNDNPFNFNKPLSFFHFFAFFFFSTGFGMLLGTVIKFTIINTFGLTAIFFGGGILLGIQLALKLDRKK